MKHAVKQKIAALRRVSKAAVSADDDKKSMALISRHFNMHPILCEGIAIAQIMEKCKNEVMTTFASPNHAEFKNYLLKNWYSTDHFKTWGRRDIVNGIPLARTTMLVEGHWFVVKSNFLLLHNRPRPDFFLFIIDSRLVPKFERDYEDVVLGRKLLRWWKGFVKEWKDLNIRKKHGVYSVRRENWKCSCPAFLQSRFLMCKHLVSDSPLPEYREIVWSRHLPFLRFERTDGRRYASIGEGTQKDGSPSIILQSSSNDISALDNSLSGFYSAVSAAVDYRTAVGNLAEWFS